MLDPIQIRYLAICAECEIRKQQGDGFQNFFGDIAARAFGKDYEDRRPQGSKGDGKCDGFKVSTGTVYQCYSPRQYTPKNLDKKIKDDFQGAKDHFQNEMKEWCLVHNDYDGLAHDQHDRIIALRKKHGSETTLSTLGPVQFLDMILRLSPTQLHALFPGIPTSTELKKLSFEEIDSLMKDLDAVAPEPSLSRPMAPSSEKISHNKLSSGVVELLKAHEITTKKYADYFAKSASVDIGNRIADKFKRHYLQQKGASTDPDAIFFSLTELAGGLTGGPTRTAAIIGLIAYLFYCCEIFEDVPRLQ